uniref:C-C motif chemokine n=1 Tax=Mola mola TaxID=94237 RepID=A0A3Q3WMR5_MOLML
MTNLGWVSLLLLVSLLSEASAQGGLGSCCLKLSETHIKRDLLKSYYQQHQPSCRIHAVVFTTLKNKRICADPTDMWTKTTMAYIDGKNSQIQHANLHHP